MVMNFLTLSNDLIGLIGKMLNNQELGKLLYYTQSNPLNQPNLNLVDLAPFGNSERILPHPFDVDYTADVRSQLHIYFPNCVFTNNQIVEDTMTFFDIVVHKSIWTIRDLQNKKKIRPYEIARLIIHELSNICQFEEMTHIAVNDEFQCIRLQAQIINWNDKYADNY
jgi:hypothetical protein